MTRKCEYLEKNEWLTSESLGSEDERIVQVYSDAYLDIYLPQAMIYPPRGQRIADDFPKLATAFSRNPIDPRALFSLSGALRTDPLGNKAKQMELALQCVQTGLQMLSQATAPQAWADAQNNLGNAYGNRIRGERAENLERAIAAYEAALQVRTRDAFPVNWGMTQNNLGGRQYRSDPGRASGEPGTGHRRLPNRPRLTPATPSRRLGHDPEQPGSHICRSDRGERAENLELAIVAYQATLTCILATPFPSIGP